MNWQEIQSPKNSNCFFFLCACEVNGFLLTQTSSSLQRVVPRRDTQLPYQRRSVFVTTYQCDGPNRNPRVFISFRHACLSFCSYAAYVCILLFITTLLCTFHYFRPIGLVLV
uniref:Uncharacterized protein n=1 Tax=Ixodes ricinus TaxID=34613 RepID=A0A0K8R4F6_IXORI